MVKLKNFMKVCLIGNNLTSLILANILSTKNLRSDIYSLNVKKTKFRSRTLGITNYNINFLSNFFPKILKKSNQIDKIKVLIKNGKVNEEILFNGNLTPLFHMMKYDDLYKYLHLRTHKNKHISFKYIKKNIESNLLRKNKKYSLVINCDSSNILTKKLLKKGIVKNYYNKAFTTIIKHSKLKNNKATQIFTKFGPIAYLPISDSLTSVVFSFDTKIKSNISKNEIIKKIFEFNPYYKIHSYEKIENFNLFLKLPKKYYYKNILFFGDTIHSIHPLAGQGFNMTIRDIIRFNEIIEKKIELGLTIDKSICKEFENKSKSINSVFSLGIDAIYEFFQINKNVIPQNISQKIFSFINKNQKVKDFGIKLANIGNL